MKSNTWIRLGLFSLFMALIAVAGFGGSAPRVSADTPPPPGLSPSTVTKTIFPGSSSDVTKTVQTPTIPPKSDIVFLSDTTGSMSGTISTVQTNIGSIMTSIRSQDADSQFAVVQYKDFVPEDGGTCGPEPAPGGFHVDQGLTTSTAAITTAVGTWSASGGCNTPEAQVNALWQIGNGAITFRSGSTRFLVWFGDEPGHDPSQGHTFAQAQASLISLGVHVVAINVGNLNGTLQATMLATATGGAYFVAATPAQVVNAILSGLSAVDVTVAMASDCATATGGVITTSFAPASRTVTSGSTATFTETISVAATAPGGTYTCKDHATINGQPMVDASNNVIYETKTIKVPEGFLTGGGQLKDGNGNNANRVSFGGNVGFLADFSVVGEIEVNFHNVSVDSLAGARFHSDSFTALQFLKDAGAGPNPPPANANVAKYTALGTVNGVSGWTLKACVSDRGEPGKNDTISFVLINPANVVVYSSVADFGTTETSQDCARSLLDSGNLQIHSGVKP